MPSVRDLNDPVSDVLSLVRMRGEFVCATTFEGPWSVRFPPPDAHLHILEAGEAWLLADGAAPRRLRPGELAMLPLGGGHVLCSDPVLAPVSITEAMRSPHPDAGLWAGAPSGSCRLVCGRFSFAGVLAPKLLGVLPELIHVEKGPGDATAWLGVTSRYLTEEISSPGPGSAVMISRLLDLLFIQAVRIWGRGAPGGLGWLSGLSDPPIGRALAAIHDDPARPWTLDLLADVAGLSRSAFAAHFADTVGQTPFKYLASWRLDLAADQLRAGAAKIGDIAVSVGYGSESALTRAFKAQFGATPAAFRRRGAPGTGPQEGAPPSTPRPRARRDDRRRD